jgi:hypothetical protein
MLKAEIRRELDRIALVTTQLAAIQRARDALIRTDAEERNNPPPCFSSSKAWALSSPRSSGWNRVSQLRQPTPGGGLQRIGAQSLAERGRRTGSGHLEVGQSPPCARP